MNFICIQVQGKNLKTQTAEPETTIPVYHKRRHIWLRLNKREIAHMDRIYVRIPTIFIRFSRRISSRYEPTSFSFIVKRTFVSYNDLAFTKGQSSV